jgi:hypothetical protein
LILNPKCYTRYIEIHLLRKWARPTLANVKKLWEKYQEEVHPPQALLTFSYNSPTQKPKELDAFDLIALSLRSVTRPVSEDKYEDYNLQESYAPRKQGALRWWYWDV